MKSGVFENRIMRISGPKRDDVTGEWRKLHNEELNDLYCSPNIVPVIKSRRMRWAAICSTYGWREVAYTGVWWGNLRERDHWGDPGVDGSIILKWIFMKWDVEVWTGLMWLRIGTGGGHLWVRWWTFGSRKMPGISWLAANRLASQEGLWSME